MTPFLRPFFKFLCSLVCLLFCVQLGANKLYLKLSKLPEVTLKAHDQSIVAFYHGYPLPRISVKNF